jgi:hypothetical protein
MVLDSHNVVFRKWDVRRKRILLAIFFPLLVLMYVVLFTTFYLTQSKNFCTWCSYIGMLQ